MIILLHQELFSEAFPLWKEAVKKLWLTEHSKDFKYLQYYDTVLLANHGALSFSDSLLSAYHKMESVEFYAQLLYQSKVLGGPKKLSDAQVERLYEIRRQFGLKGKHPADICPNAKAGLPSCHSCKGTCGATLNADCGASEDLVAQITKKVMEQLGK